MVYKVLPPTLYKDLGTRFYGLVEAFMDEEVERLLPTRDFLPDAEPTAQDFSPDDEDLTEDEATPLGLAQYYLNVEVY